MTLYRLITLFLGLVFIAISSVSCGSFIENSHLDSINGRISPTYTGVSESAYCALPISHGGSTVTITGSATYDERPSFDTGPSNGLGATALGGPIRRAEVMVVNSSGTRVQCAETDNNGDFTFQLPTGSGGHKIYINSRANNTYAKVSVLNMPEQNIHYSISKTFTPDSSKSIGTLNALATGSIVGAAFHILDLIVEANDLLRTEVGTCSASIVGCSDFTVADKVSIYWEKGFNPNSYFGSANSGLSFYLPGFSRLFILGGINGDTDFSDTDHFDDTIIVHEYGHFLEDRYSDSDSPGGSHTGKYPIDPRLALSEAWGNFFQAAVNYGAASITPMYIDTSGNIDGSTSFILDIPLETTDPGCNSFMPGCDEPTMAGEGIFREFAITRMLWDIFDTNNDGESITGNFNELWASITQGNSYILGTDSRFRDAGLLHSVQTSLSDGSSSPITDWATARDLAENYQQGDRAHYGQKVSTGGGCGLRNFNIVPLTEAGDTHEFDTSNFFYNNDFYHYKHIVSGPATFNLNYLTNTGFEANLDLFIYNEDATFGSSLSIQGKANNQPATTPAVDLENETVAITNLAAGDYLINVKVRTDNTTSVGGSTDYEITLGGSRLCP